MKKRGLSTVIATISIILLTVAAVGFIAGFAVPFVRDSLFESTECMDYKEYFTFYEDFDYNCYVNDGDYWLYGLSVRADTGNTEVVEKLEGFRLVFLRTGSSHSLDVKNGAITNGSVWGIRMLDSSIQTLEVPDSGEVRTYVFNSSEKYASLEIYPRLKSERLCEKTDELKLENEICSQPLEAS